jgi:hypothetical protein
MQMPEVPVLLVGRVFKLEPPTTIQQDGRPTKVKARVAVLSGDGASEVRLTAEQWASLSPALDQDLAWLVRFSAWKMDGGNSGQSCTFVAPVDDAWLSYAAAVLHGATATAEARSK